MTFEVYKDNTSPFASPNWGDNPIFEVCSRLCRYAVHPVEYRILRFKELSGKRRIDAVFEGKLRRSTLKNMVFLSTTQWSRLEESWSAIMMTVTMNRDFNPEIRDMHLIKCIQRFKLWYLSTVLHGCEARIRMRDGEVHRTLIGFDERHDKMCRALKTISAWMQFRILNREDNSRPKEIPWFFGWNHQVHVPTLPWMGGHLMRYMRLWEIPQVDELLVISTAQMRSFGRALPIPSRQACVADLQETVEILKTEAPEVEPHVLASVRHFAKLLGDKLDVGTMPTWTHISVSHSATVFTPQSLGGKSAEASFIVRSLEKNSLYAWCFKRIPQPGTKVESRRLDDIVLSGLRPIFDVYGQQCLYPDIFFFEAGSFPNPMKDPVRFEYVRNHLAVDGKASTMSDVTWSLLEALYTPGDQISGRRAARREANGALLPPTIGSMMLFWASGRMAQSGRFEPEPDWFLAVHHRDVLGLQDREVSIDTPDVVFIPFWMKPENVRYRPSVEPIVCLTSLAEPGAKTRGLGKNETELNFVFQAMRFMAEPVVARDGSARLGLESQNKLWDFLKYVSRRAKKIFGPKTTIMSSDFKRATDLLPLAVVKALWEGFLSGLPIDHPFWVYTELIWCGRQCAVDRQLIDDASIFTSRRGSFQGEPVSFLTLTLYNLVLLEMTDIYSSVLPLYSLEEPGAIVPRSPRAVCGDDVTAIFPTRRYSRTFRHIVRDTRMEQSPGKDGDSDVTGIFCEDHFYVRILPDGTPIVVYIDVIKCRLLTNMSRQGTSRVASVLGKGRALATQLDWFPSVRVKQVTLKIYFDLLDRLYDGWVDSMRLPLRLPSHAGGLSLPQGDPYKEWELEYVKYVFWLTDQPRTAETVTEIIKLRQLADRYRYGSKTPTVGVEAAIDLGRFTHHSGGFDDLFVGLYEIFSLEQVKEIYSIVCGKKLANPFDEEGEPTYSHVCVAARDELGLVPFWDGFDQIERALTFSELIINGGDSAPDVLSLGKWAKRASTYWRRIRRRFSSSYSSYTLPGTVTQADVNWRIQNYWNGFAFKKAFSGLSRKYGPDLTINLRKGLKPPASPQPKLRRAEGLDLTVLRREKFSLNEDDSSQ